MLTTLAMLDALTDAEEDMGQPRQHVLAKRAQVLGRRRGGVALRDIQVAATVDHGAAAGEKEGGRAKKHMSGFNDETVSPDDFITLHRPSLVGN